MIRLRPRLLVLPLLVVSLACSAKVEHASRPSRGDRLAPGSEAIIDPGGGSDGTLMMTKKGRGSIGGDMESVDTGTRVRVIEDSATETADDPDGEPEGRPVRIMILEGKHAGLPGTVRRPELRPLP